jgi:hypothetical protein
MSDNLNGLPEDVRRFIGGIGDDSNSDPNLLPNAGLAAYNQGNRVSALEAWNKAMAQTKSPKAQLEAAAYVMHKSKEMFSQNLNDEFRSAVEGAVDLAKTVIVERAAAGNSNAIVIMGQLKREGYEFPKNDRGRQP